MLYYIVYIYTCIFIIYVCTYVYMYMYRYTYIYMNLFMYMYICIHIHLHILIYIHICICIYMIHIYKAIRPHPRKEDDPGVAKWGDQHVGPAGRAVGWGADLQQVLSPDPDNLLNPKNAMVRGRALYKLRDAPVLTLDVTV